MLFDTTPKGSWTLKSTVSRDIVTHQHGEYPNQQFCCGFFLATTWDMLSEPASPCQCSCYSSVLGTILPKIRTLILKSFPNTQCLKKYSPGQKIRETKVFLTLPADVLRNHLIVITSTKKGNKASVMIIFTKQKNPKPIPSPCSEQILSISYTQHKTTLQSAIFLKTSSINTANRQQELLKTSNKSETKNPSKKIHLQELRKYPQSVSQWQL